MKRTFGVRVISRRRKRVGEQPSSYFPSPQPRLPPLARAWRGGLSSGQCKCDWCGQACNGANGVAGHKRDCKARPADSIPTRQRFASLSGKPNEPTSPAKVKRQAQTRPAPARGSLSSGQCKCDWCGHVCDGMHGVAGHKRGCKARPADSIPFRQRYANPSTDAGHARSKLAHKQRARSADTPPPATMAAGSSTKPGAASGKRGTVGKRGRSDDGSDGRSDDGSDDEQPVSASVEAQLRALAALALAEAYEMPVGIVEAGGSDRGGSEVPKVSGCFVLF